MSNFEAFMLAWVQPGIATWIAGFFWWPGELRDLHKLIMDDALQALSPIKSRDAWLMVIGFEFVVSIVAWPLLIFAVLVQALDDEE